MGRRRGRGKGMMTKDGKKKKTKRKGRRKRGKVTNVRVRKSDRPSFILYSAAGTICQHLLRRQKKKMTVGLFCASFISEADSHTRVLGGKGLDPLWWRLNGV